MAIINIDRGNGIEQMDTELLTNSSYFVDNDNEHTEITEYRLDGKVVHRSVHVHLKQGFTLPIEAGGMN